MPVSWRSLLDADRFDALSKSLSALGTRRRLLGVLTGLPLLGSLALNGNDALAKSHRQRSRDPVRAEACIPTGKPCPSKKPRGHNNHGKARTLSCNHCCQRHVTTVNGV